MEKRASVSKNTNEKSSELKFNEELPNQIDIDEVELLKPYHAQKTGESVEVDLSEIITPGREHP